MRSKRNRPYVRKDTRTDSKSTLPPSAGFMREFSPAVFGTHLILYSRASQMSTLKYHFPPKFPQTRGKGPGGNLRLCTVAASRFPAPLGPPIAPLPRKQLASSAAGGASPLSPVDLPKANQKIKSFSAGHPPEGPLLPRWGNSPSVPAENSLTQPPWAAFTSPQTGEGGI